MIYEKFVKGIILKLILHEDNNKCVKNLDGNEFLRRFKNIHAEILTKNFFEYLYDFKQDVENFCEYEEFYALDGGPALEFEIIDGRDEYEFIE